MTELQAIELLVRGGGAALMLFLAVRFACMGLRGAVDRLGSLYCVLAGLHILTGHAPPGLGSGPVFEVMRVFGTFGSVVFWGLAIALFDCCQRLNFSHAIPVGLVAVSHGFAEGALYRDLLTMGLMVHVMTLAVRDYDGDLVAFRRRFRVALAILVPALMISTIVTDLMVGGRNDVWCLYQASTFSAAALLFTIWLTRMERGLLSTPDTSTEPRPVEVPVADRLDLDKLNGAVRAGVCFEPGLTIGALAHQLDMPEHRLRRLINRGLGYRNFAAFVNDHRIEEAKRRLADPHQARAQIISHAFALGYNSLAPFNRAFRERTGQSPTAWRSAHLGEDGVPAE